MRSLTIVVFVLGLGALADARPAAAQCDDGCVELVDARTGETTGYGCMAGGNRKNCVAKRASCIDEPCQNALLTDANGAVLAVVDRCGENPKAGALALRPLPDKKLPTVEKRSARAAPERGSGPRRLSLAGG